MIIFKNEMIYCVFPYTICQIINQQYGSREKFNRTGKAS